MPLCDADDFKQIFAQLSDTPSLDNAKAIDLIREKAEEVSISAESHLRLIIKRLPELPLAEVTEFDIPKEIFEQINSRALESARKLIQAILYIFPNAEADLGAASNGAVEITWRSNNSLMWVVDCQQLSWPGVKVRIYYNENTENYTPKLSIRSFFVAHSVIEHAKELLRF